MSLFLTADEAKYFLVASRVRDYEIGFQFSYNHENRAQAFSVCTDRHPSSINLAQLYCTVDGHTHPRSIYADPEQQYHPPSNADVTGSNLNSTQWNLVFEPHGVWAYRLSLSLFKEIQTTDRVDLLVEVIGNNAAEFGICLSKVKSDVCERNDLRTVEDYIRLMDVGILDNKGNGKPGEGIEVLYFPVGTDVVLPDMGGIPGVAARVVSALFNLQMYWVEDMKINTIATAISKATAAPSNYEYSVIFMDLLHSTGLIPTFKK